MSHPEYQNIGSPVIRLVEECSELIKAACKGERFGWNNYHPDHPETTNMQELDAEMTDVITAHYNLKKSLPEEEKCYTE